MHHILLALFYLIAEFHLHRKVVSVIYTQKTFEALDNENFLMGRMAKAEKQMKNALTGKCACYVLITCTTPGADGKMEVEMNYEGDEHLAALLVENAGQVFENGPSRRESQ